MTKKAAIKDVYKEGAICQWCMRYDCKEKGGIRKPCLLDRNIPPDDETDRATIEHLNSKLKIKNQITFEYDNAIVLTGHGADKVIFHTTLPDACWPFKEKSLDIEFRAAAGKGVEYAEKHFGITPKVINT